jgi:hypothetical protein
LHGQQTLPLAPSLEKRGGIFFKNIYEITIVFSMYINIHIKICVNNLISSAPLLFSREGAGG